MSHLQLPVQHGTNKTLIAMDSDFFVVLPGETEDEFNKMAKGARTCDSGEPMVRIECSRA